MKMKIVLMAAAAALCLTSLAATAQTYPRDNTYPRDTRPYEQQRDSRDYYSQDDRDGYYDRSGSYRRMQEREARREERREQRRQDAYYQRGAYEQSCQRGNAPTGTIFGALAGGLIGNVASGGNTGATVGGVVLGGLLGNTIARDIDCNDQPYAFGVYNNGLNGQVGRRYDWNRGQNRGYFTPVREYRRSGMVCRDFTTTTYRRGREITRTGTACRDTRDGNWRFD